MLFWIKCLKKFLNNVTKLSNYFILELNKIKIYPNIIKEIRGKGFLIGIQLHFNQTNFIKIEKSSLLTIRVTENVIRILPPLNVTKRNKFVIKIIKKFVKIINDYEKFY